MIEGRSVIPKENPAWERLKQLHTKHLLNEDFIMTNQTRSLVSVVIMDQDTNLAPSQALVVKFDDVVMLGEDTQGLLMNLMIDKDMSAILKRHNEMRAGVVNGKVEERTGSSNVKLKPITVQDLDIQIR